MEKITITKEEYWEKVSKLANEIKECNDRVMSGFILLTCVLLCGMLSDKLFEEKEGEKRWN